MVGCAFFLQESYRFMEQASAIMKSIGTVLINFGNAENLPKAMKSLELTHCPPGLSGTGIAREHFKVKRNWFSYIAEWLVYVLQIIVLMQLISWIASLLKRTLCLPLGPMWTHIQHAVINYAEGSLKCLYIPRRSQKVYPHNLLKWAKRIVSQLNHTDFFAWILGDRRT